jgi:hypothetical protein
LRLSTPDRQSPIRFSGLTRPEKIKNHHSPIANEQFVFLLTRASSKTIIIGEWRMANGDLLFEYSR